MKNPLPILVFLLILIAIIVLYSIKSTHKPVSYLKNEIFASNLTELVSLNIPFSCIFWSDKTTIELKIWNGYVWARENDLQLIKKDDTLYIELPPEKRVEMGCRWLMVNASSRVYNEFKEYYPLSMQLEELDMDHLYCKVDYTLSASFFEKEGKVCWYFDLVG